MFIQEIKCVQWRNLEKVDLTLSDHLIIVQGENAQGKTNLLEAIYFLSRGGSFRRSKDQELVMWGGSYSYLGARICDGNSYFWKEVAIRPSLKKEWKINGHPGLGKRGIWLVGHFPGDREIVAGPPQARREHLDDAIGFVYPAHATLVNQYERVLARRNLLLREHADEELLATYTDKLIMVGKKVVMGRLQYLKLYVPFLKDFYARLGMNDQPLQVRYQPVGYPLSDQMVVDLEKGFESVRCEEREREMTLVGPHRDEIVFEKNGYEFRSYGSQGEKKSLTLSIKLAEMSVIQLIKKCQAIVILDDVFSELDRVHQDLLLEEILKQGQVFISTTRMNTDWSRYRKGKITVLKVEKGRIVEGMTDE